MTKLKLILASTALLIAGTAFAQSAAKPEGKPDFAARKAAMLEKFDTNKDGKLDDAEKAAMQDARIEKKFAMLDANKDGVITLAEMKAGAKAHQHKGKHRFGRRGMGHGRHGQQVK